MMHMTTTSAFGRRPVTRAQIVAQIAVTQAQASATPGQGAVHKWELLRTLSAIREGLGVSDRALSVLTALFSFHPETVLTVEADLVVFPSNRSLSLRANGMSEATLRRHLAALVEAGLIIRRDSPNGKRFVRRDDAARQLYGFDLAPLVARAGDFQRQLEDLRGEQLRLRLLKERVNLLRRDLTKRIAFALDEVLPGPWDALRQDFLALCAPLRQVRAVADLDRLAAALDALQAGVAQALVDALAPPHLTGSAAQSDRHILDSTPDASRSEPTADEAIIAAAPVPVAPGSAAVELPLRLVLDACPDVAAFGDPIVEWSDFIAVAATVRPMLGVSLETWWDAVQTLGRKHAAVAVAFILQRCEHSSEASRLDGGVLVNGSPAIRSPGGYLRALTDKGRAGGFVLWPAILAHLAQRAKHRPALRVGRHS